MSETDPLARKEAQVMDKQNPYTPLDTSGFSEALRERTYDPAALIGWARRYNGYKRLGANPGALNKVLSPLVEEIATSGKIPEWQESTSCAGWRSGGFASPPITKLPNMHWTMTCSSPLSTR
jgi:hypothetical protein